MIDRTAVIQTIELDDLTVINKKTNEKIPRTDRSYWEWYIKDRQDIKGRGIVSKGGVEDSPLEQADLSARAALVECKFEKDISDSRGTSFLFQLSPTSYMVVFHKYRIIFYMTKT